jgi:Carboxypeptidase regulatory-like domain
MTSIRLSGYWFWILLVIAASIALTPSLLAQSAGTGALTGRVTDATGAVVPGVTVTLTSTDTNQTRSTTTDENGSYRFSLLPPGTYGARFAIPGFKTSEVSLVTVRVTETVALDRALEVGAQTEAVTVETQTEVLQTTTSTLGGTVGATTVTQLPLSTRNYTQILALSAGTNTTANNATAFGKGTQNMSVNGNDPGQNNFQMDGVNVTNFANSGTAGDSGLYAGIGVPSPDALQEFKVQTSTYDASYGRNPGANVNVVTKSGTNQFHGTAFEYLRDSIFNANSFFYNRDNRASATTKQILNQNQFGGVLGGPVIKNKLFAFFSYQGTRQKNGIDSGGFTNALLPPIPDGDRRAPGFRTALGAANCQDNHPGDNNFGGFGGQKLACDGSNINDVALNILNLKLDDGSYFFPSSGTSGYKQTSFSSPAIYNSDQELANFDYVQSTKHTISGRWFNTKDPQVSPLRGQLPGAPLKILFANTYAVLKATSILTNSLVNEARVSYQRNLSTQNAPAPPNSDNSILGITPMSPGVTKPPQITFISGGYSILGGGGPTLSVTNQYQVADQISWSRGKHTFRFGGELERNDWPIIWSGVRGGLSVGTFNDLLVGGPGNPQTATPGNIQACLFCSRSDARGIIHEYSARGASAYFQDDFKYNSRLTLNLGVRWEFNGALTDKYGNLTQTWVSRIQAVPIPPTGPTNSGPGVGQWVVPNNYTKFYPQPPDGILINDRSSALRKRVPLSSFGPRLGFAYQATSKLVVRGGAGIFYDRVGADRIVYSVEQGNPYAATVDFNPQNTQTLANPFPATPVLGTFSSRWANFETGQTSNLNVPLLAEVVHNPLIRQYNLGVQYQFAPSWVLEVGYVGSSGINLMTQYHNHNTARLASPEHPINGITTNTVLNVPFRVPYLGYQAVGVRGTDFDGASSYNSLQATLRKQFSRGFLVQGAYTWSKNLTNLANNQANSNNADDMWQQYGPAQFSRPQRFVANYSYDLPFGTHSGVMERVLGGWNVSGVTVIQGGTPMTIADPQAGTIYGTAGSAFSGFGRAQLCQGMTYADIATPGDIKQRLGGASGGPGYFNKAAFCPPPAIGNGTDYGNTGIGIIYGPGQFNWDIAILKRIRILEDHTIQFRTEFFNAFNHTQFSNPNYGSGATYALPNFRSGAFGQITSTSVNPRVIQFALKYSF